MKRTNIIFTSINILVIATMLIHIGICYFNFHTFNVGPSIVFLYALVYIPPLILINVIWRVVRRKKSGGLPPEETPAANVLARNAVGARLVNIIAIALNILIVVMVLIYNANYMREVDTRMSYFEELIGNNWIYGIIPFILVNDAWVVVRMNLKRAN